MYRDIIAQCEEAGIEKSICVKASINMCFSCLEDHIDLRGTVGWQTQLKPAWTDYERRVGCIRTCRLILKSAGLSENSAPSDDVYQVAEEKSNVSIENQKNQSEYLDDKKEAEEGLTYIAEKGLTYINEQLKEGYPIIVGVDHTYNYSVKKGDKYIKVNEGTTDHFVVIIGKSCEKGKIFYYFYEVATEHEKYGKSNDNKLYLGKNFSLRGKTAYSSSREYYVTQIRKNVKK